MRERGGVAGGRKRSAGGERGSALLIVFVFAAIVAIMLYRELPSVAFEARRQKEQLLIDRGHEYVRAIQLYYRRFKRYPPSIDALESTNQMRFLRHRFDDPFTGKDDWRLIHTNGLALTDSKVTPLKNSTNNKNQNSGSSSSGWFTNSNSGFDSDSSSKQASSNDQPEVVVPPVRTRPPAIRADGAAGGAEGAPADDGLEAPLQGANQDDGDLNAQLQASLQGQTNATGSNTQPSTQQTGGQESGGSNTPNPMQMVRNMLSSESPLQPQQVSSTTGAVQGGGGIAGVASKAGGHTIKVIGDQTDYSLWEFVYDPTKDKTGQPGAPGGMQQPQNGNATSPSATSSSSTATGSSPFSTSTSTTSSSSTGTSSAPATPNTSTQPAEGTTVGNNGSAQPVVRTVPQ